MLVGLITSAVGSLMSARRRWALARRLSFQCLCFLQYMPTGPLSLVTSSSHTSQCQRTLGLSSANLSCSALHSRVQYLRLRPIHCVPQWLHVRSWQVWPLPKYWVPQAWHVRLNRWVVQRRPGLTAGALQMVQCIVLPECEQPHRRETWGCSGRSDQLRLVFSVSAWTGLAAHCVLCGLLLVVLVAEALKVGPCVLVASFGQGEYVVDFGGEAVAADVLAVGLAAEFGCAQGSPFAAAGFVGAAFECWSAAAGLAFGGWLSTSGACARRCHGHHALAAVKRPLARRGRSVLWSNRLWHVLHRGS